MSVSLRRIAGLNQPRLLGNDVRVIGQRDHRDLRNRRPGRGRIGLVGRCSGGGRAQGCFLGAA